MLLYGPDGSLWPAGSLIRTLTTDNDIAWESGTLPSWLTVGTDGTDAGASAAAATSTEGGVTVTNATGGSLSASLLGPEITLSELRRVRLDVVGMIGATANRRIYVGFMGADSGAWITQRSAGIDGGASFIARSAGPTDTSAVATSYNLGYFDGSERYPVTIIIDPADGMIAVGEHDQIWTHYTFGAAMGTGTVRPIIRALTETGTGAPSITLHQVRLTREWL